MILGTLHGDLLTIGTGAAPSLETMILGMSRQPRWAGQTSMLWTVAHHALLVASLVPPEYRAEALHHDDEEVFLGDWPTPLVRVATIEGEPAEVYRAKVRQWAASRWFAMPAKLSPTVKAADRRALIIEATFLCHRDMIKWLGVSGDDGVTGTEGQRFREIRTIEPDLAGMKWGVEVLSESSKNRAAAGF